MPDLQQIPSRPPRRSHSRLRLGIEGWLTTVTARQKVRLVDLSQSGARVILGDSRPVGDTMLGWLDFETFGYTVWQHGRHLGIAFEDCLPLEQVIETRRLAPEIVREESLSLQRAAQEWVTGIPDA